MWERPEGPGVRIIRHEEVSPKGKSGLSLVQNSSSSLLTHAPSLFRYSIGWKG